MSDHSQSLSFELGRLRVEYRRRSLSEEDVDRDPIRQFIAWFGEARASEAIEPNAMTLATSSPDGSPSARLVLLKGVDDEGFVFFTNYDSSKGRELALNPRAALVFWWAELERQVRIEGTAGKTSEEESETYFKRRPTDSRIGAAASPQSEQIASRQELEARAAALRARYPDGNVPRPANWGGYRVRPHRIEFWQGRESRLHDRIEYRREGQAVWTIRRLAP
jgi:pyridoxamine 5'-phosphate oxidase